MKKENNKGKFTAGVKARLSYLILITDIDSLEWLKKHVCNELNKRYKKVTKHIKEV